MLHVLAFPVEITYESLTVLFSGLVVIVVFGTGVVWKIRQQWSKLNIEEQEHHDRMVNETSRLTDQALEVYKDLYAALKESSEIKYRELSERFSVVVDRVKSLEAEAYSLREENAKLQGLNIKLQEQARNDTHSINGLKQRIFNLENSTGHPDSTSKVGNNA